MKKALSIVFGLGGILCLLGLWLLGGSPRERMGSTARRDVGPATAVSGLGEPISVGTPGVVYEDKFKLARFLVQRPGDFTRERQDVVLLVEDRNDDGDVGRHEPNLTVEG